MAWLFQLPVPGRAASQFTAASAANKELGSGKEEADRPIYEPRVREACLVY